MRVAHILGVDEPHFYGSITHVDGGKGWQPKQQSIRNTLGSRPGGATRMASGPEKSDKICEDLPGSGIAKAVATPGVVTVHVPRGQLPRRSGRLEHNRCCGLTLMAERVGNNHVASPKYAGWLAKPGDWRSIQTRKNRQFCENSAGVWNCESSGCIKGCDGTCLHVAGSLAGAGG